MTSFLHAGPGDAVGPGGRATSAAGPAGFGVHLRRENGAAVVIVDGELDTFTSPRLREFLAALVNERDADVVVDLADVAFLDSTALGVLLAARRHARDRGGD